MIKIVGITTAGTYYSPWFPYTIASIYNVCDEIIVVNGGFDINNPDKEVFNVPLKQVSNDIKHLDIKNKITELTHFTIDDLNEEHRFTFSSQHDYNEGKLDKETKWFDCRGTNITLAQDIACQHGATHILKIDSDQACYQNVRSLRHFDEKVLDSGIIFHQYEFGPNLRHLVIPKPGSPFDDSVFIYKSHTDSFYYGGGAPALYTPRWFLINNVHCAHLRRANPDHLTEEEKFRHFYERSWYEKWTNTGLWNTELTDSAHSTATNRLKIKGLATTINPPEACLFKDPLNYIKERLE